MSAATAFIRSRASIRDFKGNFEPPTFTKGVLHDKHDGNEGENGLNAPKLSSCLTLQTGRGEVDQLFRQLKEIDLASFLVRQSIKSLFTLSDLLCQQIVASISRVAS